MSDSRLVTLRMIQEGVYEVEKEWDDQAQKWVRGSGERLVRAITEADRNHLSRMLEKRLQVAKQAKNKENSTPESITWMGRLIVLDNEFISLLIDIISGERLVRVDETTGTDSRNSDETGE